MFDFDYAVSIHIDRPGRLRVQQPVTALWEPAMQEITRRTASTFGATIVGLHCPAFSTYTIFASAAHIRGADGGFITPDDPADRLYQENGQPVANAMRKSVRGALIDAMHRRADDHAFFAVGTAAYDNTARRLQSFRDAPPAYNAIHNNCVRFGIETLAAAGVRLETQAAPRHIARLRRPEDISSVLALHPARPGIAIMTGQPLLMETLQRPLEPPAVAATAELPLAAMPA